MKISWFWIKFPCDVSWWRLLALTHLPMCRIYASVNQVSVGSDNDLSLGRRQAIIWPNAGILLIGPLGINFSEISFRIQNFSLRKMQLKLSSAKWQPFCPGGDELLCWCPIIWPSHYFFLKIGYPQMKPIIWTNHELVYWYTYHLNQSWLSLLMHLCVTLPQCDEEGSTIPMIT